jgi:hypothetical protein
MGIKMDSADDEMLPEYDFSGGVRGKHYQAYRRGYQVIIHKTDGTTESVSENSGSGVRSNDFSRFWAHESPPSTTKVITTNIFQTPSEVRDFALPEGTVVLDPDVRAYFPDSEAVNRTLRGLISLMPQQRTPKATS